MTNAQERFMQTAMEEARRGVAEGNAAVGSVVVRGENLIARGRNLVVTQSDPTTHAETVALRSAGAAMGHTDVSGLGKSHLVTALGLRACECGHSVLFTSAIDAINTLAAAKAAGQLKRDLARYLRPRLLILDELGYLPIDNRAQASLGRAL